MAARKKKKPGWQGQQEQVVRQVLGNYPIRDARTAHRTTVNAEDIRGAKRGDPYNCALTRSHRRTSGINEGFAVFRQYAFIPFDKKQDGNIVIERFAMDARTRRAVAAFDRDGIFSPGEYIFRAPSVTQRLGAHAKYKDNPKGGGGKHGGDGPPRLSMLGVRNGKGKKPR